MRVRGRIKLGRGSCRLERSERNIQTPFCRYDLVKGGKRVQRRDHRKG